MKSAPGASAAAVLHHHPPPTAVESAAATPRYSGALSLWPPPPDTICLHLPTTLLLHHPLPPCCFTRYPHPPDYPLFIASFIVHNYCRSRLQFPFSAEWSLSVTCPLLGCYHQLPADPFALLVRGCGAAQEALLRCGYGGPSVRSLTSLARQVRSAV